MSAPARRRRIAVPHVYVIVFGLTVLMAVAGAVVPGGAYERDAEGRVLPDTFRFDRTLAGEAGGRDGPRGAGLVLAVLTAPLRGIEDAADIIAFILIIGGAFKVIERSGAFDAAIRRLVRALAGRSPPPGRCRSCWRWPGPRC